MEFLVQFIFILFFPSVQAGDITDLNFFKKNPTCRVEKNYLYLTEEKARALDLNRIIQRYNINCEKLSYVGYLFDDKIRTHFQNLFIVLNGKKVVDVEVINFSEPEQYSAPQKWIELMFLNKQVDNFKIDSISGATLTTQSYKRIFKKLIGIHIQ